MSHIEAETDSRTRDSGGRLVFISFFGPPVGIAVYMLVVLTFDRPSNDPTEIFEVLVVVLLMGWPLGIVPAALSALVWRFVPKPRETMGRLGLALLVGAVAGPIGLGVVMWYLDVTAMDLALGALFAFSGAVALAATAIPFSKGWL